MSFSGDDFWNLLAFLALIAIIAIVLRGVFRSTGKKPIKPSGRDHDHDVSGGTGSEGND